MQTSSSPDVSAGPQRNGRAATDDPRREQRLINEIMELLVTHHGGGMSEKELDDGIDRLQAAN